MQKLLTYALKDGRLTHISDVENGYQCGCICPECKEELSAVANIEGKAYERRPHFSHRPNSICSGGYESALHLLVKEVFAETKQIFVPDFHYDYNPRNEKSIYSNRGKIMSFDSVIIEKEISFEDVKFKPDAIGKINEKFLFVEFAVTSFCDEEKLSKIRRSKTPTIEIAINPKTAFLEAAYLKDQLLDNNQSKYFLFNPRLEEKYKKEQQDKLDKEKLKVEENLKKENIRIKNLIQCKKYNILLIQDGQVSQCPKNNDFLNYFKSTEYYNHPELKKILNGAFWNGEFYGHANTIKYIYINKFQVVTSSMDATHEESRVRDLLYKGLLEFKRRKERFVKNCTNCRFRKGENTMGDKNYITCGYLIDKKPIIDAKIQ